MDEITNELLQKFTEKYTDENDADSSELQSLYKSAAVKKVSDFLGYSPILSDIEEYTRGDGTSVLSVNSWVHSVERVSDDYNQVIEDSLLLDFRKNYIERLDGGIFEKNKLYHIKYKGGFDPLPADISMVILQIASLLWESAGGNLAVNSKSFPDMGTRVFNNFSPDRFLEQLKGYCIHK